MSETNGRVILAPLMAAIEVAINQYLALDPDSPKMLQQINGKVIKLHVTSPQLELFLLPAHNSIQVLNNYQDLPDTTISGTLFAFMNMGVAAEHEKNQAVFSGKINIDGDIPLGQKFQALFENLDIDWEEHLSHVFGDIIAHKLGNLGRQFFSWGKQSHHSLAMDGAEFLQYETRDLLEKREVAEFLKQVDTLRSDVDRIEARIRRLSNSLNQKCSI